jgi:hypothetical protein
VVRTPKWHRHDRSSRSAHVAVDIQLRVPFKPGDEEDMQPCATNRSPLFGHVLVLSGPSCVGKSTLLNRLFNGEMPRLSEALGLREAPPYTLVHADDWSNLEKAPCESVLLHYDLTRKPFWAREEERDKALEILDQARSITFLTLWELPEELRGRFLDRSKRRVVGNLKSLRVRRAWKETRWYLRKRSFFTRSDQMWQLYRQWFDFTSKFSDSQHWVLRSTVIDDAPMLLPAMWREPFWDNARFSPRAE